MTKHEKVAALVSKGFVSQEQESEFQAHASKGIFSLNAELLLLLYLSILLFTSGVGILIYKNIDSIGHSVLLILNLLLAIACFYVSFKKWKGFSKEPVFFANSMYDYVVLTGTLLACIFVGYFQYQYEILGTNYQWVSLVSALLCFGVAYYFDQRTVLSMAITSLTAFVGITLTPKTLLDNAVYDNPQLSYYGLFLAIILLLWVYFSEQQQLKKHFSFVYYTFAQHLSGICIIAGLIETYWGVFILFSAGITYYFYQLSFKIKEVSLFVFALIYGYIGLNIVLGRLLSYVDFGDILPLFAMMVPLYVVGSIALFIKAVRNFNQKKYASV